MTIWIGTSGYAYKEWKGSFYPEKMAPARMLPYYAERLSTVEINATYYRAPTEKSLANWSAQTPPRFKLTLKAPKRITHEKRLRDCAEETGAFCEIAATLGSKLGALLFQLPPGLQKNLELFDAFLATLPEGSCAAFEFRHVSWLDEEIYARLKARNLALCIADSEDFSTPITFTANYAYFRLRDEGYSLSDIVRWAQVVRDAGTKSRNVFVYFKHEKTGKGPEFARRMIEALEEL